MNAGSILVLIFGGFILGAFTIYVFRPLWYAPLKELPRRQVNLVPVLSGTTFDSWQKSDELINWAKTSEEFSRVLSIVQSFQPTGFPIRGAAVTDTQCNVELGRKEGYSDCYHVLLSLREFPIKLPEEIPADYSGDESPLNQE